MKSLISYLALIWLAIADPSLVAKDGYLDPGKITWWNDNWTSNPIDLSQTNSGTSSVTVTINFRPQTSLPTTGNMGIVQVTVPSTFSSTGTFTSPSMALKSGTDTSYSFSLSTSLPSAGVYGPFQIITRTSATGQIYDANYVFGCVAVSASVSSPTSSSLTVNAVTLTSTTATVGSADGLYFTFTIPAGVNLWKHDIFEIVPDKYWTIPSSPTCSSVDISTVTNYIKGPKGDSSLPCAIAQSGGASGRLNTAKSSSATGNSVYIYGLSQDVIINSSYQVKLKVSSFTLPSIALSSSSYQWTLKIWRWGTTTLLTQFAGSGPLTPVAGSITVNSWAPLNSNVQSADIPNGSNSFYIFTKLTFQTSHPIATGSITITFANVDINGGKWWQDVADSSSGSKGLCFLNTYAKGVTCSVSSSNQVATISFDSTSIGLAANTAISITLLTKFSASAKVSSIISTDSTSSSTIDQFNSGYAWTFGSTSSYTSMTDFKFFATDAASYKGSTKFTTGLQIGGNLSTSQYLLWFVSPSSSSWTTNTKLVVSLPYSSSGVQLTQAYIKSTALIKDKLLTSLTADTSLGTTTNTITQSPGTAGSISITFASGNAPVSGTSYYAFTYGDPASGDTKVTSLPYVTSNLGTFYECWAKATLSGSSSPLEFSSYVFSVYPSSTKDSTTTYAPLCSDKYVGVPISANFHARTLKFDFTDKTYHYYLDISFAGTGTTNMGSGLTDGSTFPVTSTSSGVTPTATISSNTVTISGLGSVNADSNVNILLPNGDATSAAGTMTFYYLLDGADPSNKMVLYTSSVAYTLTDTSSSKAFTTPTFSSPSSGAYTVGGTSVSTSLNLGLSTTTSVSNYIGVGLPAGFTLSSGYQLTLGGTKTTAYGVSSSSSSFAGGFIIGSLSSAVSITSAGVSLALSSINAPLSTGKSSDAASGNFLVFATAAGSALAACTAINQVGGKINAALISSDSCSSDKLYTQGPDSVDSTLTLTFIIKNPIPANGKIVITLSSAWTLVSTSSATPPVSTCEGVSFTDYSTSKPKSCAVDSSASTVTLTQFSQISVGTVTIKVYHVVPSSTTNTSLKCYTAVNTYDANGNLIDSASNSLTNSVVVTASSTSGTTNTSSFVSKAYPNVAKAISDIYLTFSLSKAVPQYGIIKITPGFVNSLELSGDITNSCWTDQDTYSCTISGSSIQLQLSTALAASQAIKVYLDMALTLPSSNSTTSGWTISSSWGGVSITADSPSASPATFQQTVGAAVTATISLASALPINSQNAGETSSYTFTFTSGVVIAISDSFVIEFPKQFSPLLGEAKISFPDCSPNNYYLTCSSTTLGIASGTYCSVDHWKLTVTGITKATTATTTSIDITVDMIQNPVAGTTNGKFSLYQYGSDGSVKAYVQKASSATISSIAANTVSLKDALVDNTNLAKSATYTFDFYLSTSTTFTTDYSISILFPHKFNIKLRNGSTVACKSVYFDESSTSTSATTSSALSSATSCAVSKNSVSLSFPSSLSSATQTTSRIQVQLTGFYNPESGLARTNGWDVTDYSSFSSTKFDVYSSKFAIAINQASKVQTYAKSYGLLNSAYIGYTLGSSTSSIQASSSSSSAIKLLPGQQSSDIIISVSDSNKWPMKSKSFKLSPTSNTNYPDSGNLKYTSAFYSFTTYQMNSQISFRVSAAIGTATGIYYIDWGTPSEKLQDGVSSALYSAPASMMVEVCSTLSSITISVDTLPTFYQYYTSLPIKVKPANSPASQLIVTPTFSVTGITVTPTSLTFSPDVNELYFQVKVGSTYKASTATQPTLSFALSGTDAAAFTAPSKMTATISSSYPSVITATPGLSVTKVSASEVKVAVTTSVAGVLYWGLGCRGSPVLTFAGLSALVSDFVTPSKSIQTLQEQLAYQYQHTETDIDTTKGDTDINSFFRRIHSEHCSDYWASSQVITTSGATLDFNWLIAGTSYTFSAYIATRLTNNTGAYPLSTYNFTTDAAGQYYSTSVTFTGSVASSSSSNIAKVLAKNMGVNPSWLTYVGSSRRILADSSSSTTTTFTYNVLSDSRYPLYTSSSMITNLNTNQAQAKSDFSSQYSLTASNLGTSTAISTGATPTWTTAPAKSALADTSATFTATSSVAGNIYASCSHNDLTGRITYAWQVVDGLDATADDVPSANIANSAATSVSLKISGLKAGTSYICYFTACNNYPITPSCIDYTSTTPLQSISIKTTGSSNPGSSAATMMGVSTILALILILLN